MKRTLVKRFLYYSLLKSAVLVATVLLLGVSRPSDSLPANTDAGQQAISGHDELSDAQFLDISYDRLLNLLDDPKHRVSSGFKVPQELKNIVGFWLQIYAKYSLHQTLIYDRDKPEIIYEVIDNRSLFRKGLSPVVIELTTKSRIKRSLEAYRSAFRTLQRNPKAKFAQGTPGANAIRLCGHLKASEWRKAEFNLRTQAGQRDRIMQGLTSADPFLPAMEAIFRKSDIPIEITRLPLVESSFDLRAHSKAAAVGVWQFLERSARGDKLIVDAKSEIDERRSPIKSTAAAAKMFRRNYKLLHDWNLAIIAYNHGAKHLIPLRDRYGGHNIVKLLQKTSNTPLGYASRSYFAEFLALLHAERYRDQLYEIPHRNHSDAISIVKIKKPASVFEVAALYNISIHELKLFNPDIFNLKKRLPSGTRVVLPRKHGESIVNAPEISPHSNRRIASEVDFIEYGK